MIRKLVFSLLLVCGLAFGQAPETALLAHSQMYFNTEQAILDMLGEPVAVDTTAMMTNFGPTEAIVYSYAMANGHEMIWLVFGRFGDWYPDYYFVEELNKEKVVVTITYFPLLPEMDAKKIEDYFK